MAVKINLIALGIKVATRARQHDHRPGGWVGFIGVGQAFCPQMDDIAGARKRAAVNVRGAVGRRTDDKLVVFSHLCCKWSPLAIRAHCILMHRPAFTRTGVAVNSKNLKLSLWHWQIVDKRTRLGVPRGHPQTSDLAVQNNGVVQLDTEGFGRFAGDETVGRIKSRRRKGGFAMIDARDHRVDGTFELRPFKTHVGRRAFGTYPHTIGLGKLVVVVGADGEPAHRSCDLVAIGVFGRIQRRQKRPCTCKLAALAKTLDGPDPVVGCTPQNRM